MSIVKGDISLKVNGKVVDEFVDPDVVELADSNGHIAWIKKQSKLKLVVSCTGCSRKTEIGSGCYESVVRVSQCDKCGMSDLDAERFYNQNKIVGFGVSWDEDSEKWVACFMTPDHFKRDDVVWIDEEIPNGDEP